MTDVPEFTLDRTFNAPRNDVWRAWTDPELLARWYGPGVDTIIHKFDLKPGGQWLNEMKWGENSNFSKMTFTEIVPLEKLVMHQSTTDADWQPTINPKMPDWPRILLTTITFTDKGGSTDLRLVWSPHDATDAERACFAGAMENLGMGWGSGFDLIDEILQELQSAGN